MTLLGSQGCLAGAWVAVVGLDSSRTADVTFAPFEHSWVATPSLGNTPEKPRAFHSVAVVPFDGDTVMSARLANVFEQHTLVQVVPATSSTEAAVQALAEQGAGCRDGAGRERIAQAVGRDLHVDTVLVGYVHTAAADPSAWGWKDREERRLYLYWLNQQGETLWKDELPFTVVKGTKPPLEAAIVGSLAEHLLTHASTLGLHDFGLAPRRPAS